MRIKTIRKEVAGESKISTIRVVTDPYCHDMMPPYYETMVFGGPMDGEQLRCKSLNEAIAQHEQTVSKVREAQSCGGIGLLLC